MTWGIPFALYVERRTTMLNQVAHLVWVPHVDLRLPPTCSFSMGLPQILTGMETSIFSMKFHGAKNRWLVFPRILAFTKRHCVFYLSSKNCVRAQNQPLSWCWAHGVFFMCLAVLYLYIIWVHIGFMCVYFAFTLLSSTWWTQNGFKSAHREHKTSWTHASTYLLNPDRHGHFKWRFFSWYCRSSYQISSMFSEKLEW